MAGATLALLCASACKRPAPPRVDPQPEPLGAAVAVEAPASSSDAGDPLALENLRLDCYQKKNAATCYTLGKLYLEGKVRDPVRAMQALELGCNEGGVPACNDLAQLLLDSGVGGPDDLTRVVALFRRACSQRDGTACANLGLLTFHGRGVVADRVEAARLYRVGCDSRVPQACLNLALMFDKGQGIPQDKAQGVRMYERACREGLPEGCMNLGVKYLRGEGVAKDPARALGFNKKACEIGQSMACYNVAVMLGKGGAGIAQDVEEGKRFLARACSLGDKRSCEMIRNAGGSPPNP
jgi:hypothetical protein